MAKLRIYRNATITGFKEDLEARTLIIYFAHHGVGGYHTFANPALAYRADDEERSPVAIFAKKKVVTDITVQETEEGFKTYECLKPTEARVKAYNEALTKTKQSQIEVVEISETELKDQGF